MNNDLNSVLTGLGFKHADSKDVTFDYWTYIYPDSEAIIIGEYFYKEDAVRYNEGFFYKIVYHTMIVGESDYIRRYNTSQEVIEFILED